MERRSRQFGLFALVLLMTATAGCFAIIRLPLPVIAKILIIQSIVVCFLGWALRNRKYPDPRVQMQSPQSVGMTREQPKLTLQHMLMVASVGCIWAAQALIQNRYGQSHYGQPPEYTTEIKVLGSVNLMALCAAIALRKRGNVALWAAIAAVFVATCIAAVVSAFRY